MTDLILHGYWRSGTSYRTRIALGLKKLAYQYRAVNLLAGEQRGHAYRSLQPQGLVPTLEVDGHVLAQSPAIIEYLEERWPEPALLPADLEQRAVVRAMAAVIGCDVHPLGNLRILQYLKGELGAPPENVKAWIARWIGDGFAALEVMVRQHGGAFAFGDEPGVVECYLLPQIYAAERFEVDITPFKSLRAVAERALADERIAAAHPDRQPDASVA